MDRPEQNENGNTNPIQTEFTILDYILIIAKWKKLIFVSCLLAATISVVISLVVPTWWTAKATIFVGGSASSSSQLSGLNIPIDLSGLLGGGGDDGERYLAILNSRRLREGVVKRFDLVKEYDVDYVESAIEVLGSNLQIDYDFKESSITIWASYKEDSLKCVELVEYIVGALDSINKELGTEKARFFRQFLEKRYAQAVEDLKTAETKLNTFQNKHGIVEFEAQAQKSMEVIAEMYKAIIATEVEYDFSVKTLGANHPQVNLLKTKLTELRQNLSSLEKGREDLSMIKSSKLLPDLGMEYFRNFRNVEINIAILEFLTPQYEQAKLQESKDTPTLQVLDPPVPPEIRSFPKRKIMVLAITGATFVFSCLLALVLEQFHRAKEMGDDRYAKILTIKEELFHKKKNKVT